MTLYQAIKLYKLFNTSPNWKEIETQEIILELGISNYAEFLTLSLSAATILAREYLRILERK